MRKPVEPPHIVEDFMIGNTRIKIADNYCRNTTKEEVDRIMNRVKQIALDAWAAQEVGNSQKERR